MFPLENLDKKSFNEILKESKRNIHRFTQEWTDENYHDPGITFLEMFSWLTEMQRYYLNRIPNNNHHKFLQLYGIELNKDKIATTYVSFNGAKDNVVIPKGTKLLAEEQVFEIENSIMITDNSLQKIMVYSDNDFLDSTYSNLSKNALHFYCFGERVEKSNRLYLGFSKGFSKGETIELLFNLFLEYPVFKKGKNSFNYGVKGKWYTYTENNLWEELECISDTTEQFSSTGTINLKITSLMKKKVLDYIIESNYYWIMFEVEEVGAQPSPKVDNILMNIVKAKNIDQKARIVELSIENAQAEIDDYLAIYGDNIIQYYTDGYWIDLQEDEYSIETDYTIKKTKIAVKKQCEKLRLISYDSMFKSQSILGSSNGLPNQYFKFNHEKLLSEAFIIQAGRVIEGKVCWKDFNYEESFVSADEYTYSFIFDTKEGFIVFGDGEKGVIPFKMENNLRIISLATTNKERGNVKDGEINDFLYKVEELQGTSVTNVISAEGGRARENIGNGQELFLKDFNEIHRAVTKEDYEVLVTRIPGIRIAMTKTILNKNFPNTVSIVVVPYTGKVKPVPDIKLLNIVKTYLEEYRLITTKVQVLKPTYIEVSVKCIVAIKDINSFDKNKLKKHIKEYLSPITEDKINFQYEIGDKIYVSEILKIINKFSKVKYVKTLWIDGKGEGVFQDKNGNLILPENGISYCGSIKLDITD